MYSQLWGIDEVGQYCDVSSSTVRRWIRDGMLVGHKAGNQWRFDPIVVREALESGRLAGGGRASRVGSTLALHREPPDWARPMLTKWHQSVVNHIDAVQPSHVIVNDRRGASIWMLVMPNHYSWGHNLWHSTAMEFMTPQELSRTFARKRVLLFDEMIQHGREVWALRDHLERLGALVTSFVCVRRRSHLESGELLEYKGVASEDVDDKVFAERATSISRLVSLFEPPLDVDHVVVRGTLSKDLTPESFLERLAEWGLSYVVWHPDQENPILALTLDRPQFFDTADIELPSGFSVSWKCPCKVRLYANFKDRTCLCSFIVYPVMEAPLGAWTQAASVWPKVATRRSTTTSPSGNNGDDAALVRTYGAACAELALELLNDFVVSGAADSAGIRLNDTADAVNRSQFRATFGPSQGDAIARRARTILAAGARGSGLFPPGPASPPPMMAREESNVGPNSHDSFLCRVALLKTIPARYASGDSDGQESQPLSYGDLMHRLPQFTESTVGRVLDFELDSGTVKPVIQADHRPAAANGGVARVWRGFFRGEFGVWFEYDRTAITHMDTVIQRTLGVGPTVVEQFLTRLGQQRLTATHFDKLFANLQHDWRPAFDKLYLGWRPYKYGPIPTVPILAPSGDYMRFEDYLIEMKCLSSEREPHGSRHWLRYWPGEWQDVPWSKLYADRTTSTTRSHVRGLIRLYAAIEEQCKSTRRHRIPDLSLLGDPLVVLGTARNEVTTYRCGWFEVTDWRKQGERFLFPLMKAVAETADPPTNPVLQARASAFAAPARLLLAKIECYRNMPRLRQEIEELCRRGDYEADEVVLETIDAEPRFETHSSTPVGSLEWACGTMRSFTSMLRQVLTDCHLDVDERDPSDDGEIRDSSFYLGELLHVCPELGPLEADLQAAVRTSKLGVLTPAVAGVLERAFESILQLLDARIVDPRPPYETDRERLEAREGMVIRAREIPLPPPYAVAVVDIRNFLNLSKLGVALGITYDEGVEGLLVWLGRAARSVVGRHPGVCLCGEPGDNAMLAGPNADEVLLAVIDLIQETSRRLGDIDEKQVSHFGLLRAGIAWCDPAMGEEFSRTKSTFTAHALADKFGQPWGTISITDVLHRHLSPLNQEGLGPLAGQDCGQGPVVVRRWDPDRERH